MSSHLFLFAKWFDVAAARTIVVHDYPAIDLPFGDPTFHVRVHFVRDLSRDEPRTTQMVLGEYSLDDEQVHVLTGGWAKEIRRAPEHRIGLLPPLPLTYSARMGTIADDLSARAAIAWELLAWRLNILGALLPTPRHDSRTLHWRVGDWLAEYPLYDGWNSAPADSSKIGSGGFVNLELPSEVLEDLSRRHFAKRAAPLGHSLLREAERLSSSERRSALIIAVAAAESAIKQFIVDLAPDTEWLIHNVQSPPIEKLLEQLVPTLATRSRALGPPPPDLKKLLKMAVEDRNKVVHGRSVDLSANSVLGVIVAIRDLLYVLDYARGEDWAIEYVSQTTRAKWHGLPS